MQSLTTSNPQRSVSSSQSSQYQPQRSVSSSQQPQSLSQQQPRVPSTSSSSSPFSSLTNKLVLEMNEHSTKSTIIKIAIAVAIIIVVGIMVYLIYSIYSKHQQRKRMQQLLAELSRQSTSEESSSTPSSSSSSNNTRKEEVFNIGNNIFSYTDARAVCTALGAKLATREQLQEAYNQGADYCNYGWTEGQLALYPTQKSTYDKLQQGPVEHRHDCGSMPGIVGGYFENPNLKFGANCYGVKRTPNENDKTFVDFNPDYTTSEERLLQEKIEKYKRHLDELSFMPFSRTSWSEWDK